MTGQLCPPSTRAPDTFFLRHCLETILVFGSILFLGGHMRCCLSRSSSSSWWRSSATGGGLSPGLLSCAPPARGNRANPRPFRTRGRALGSRGRSCSRQRTGFSPCVSSILGDRRRHWCPKRLSWHSSTLFALRLLCRSLYSVPFGFFLSLLLFPRLF